MNDIIGAAFAIMDEILKEYTDDKFTVAPADRNSPFNESLAIHNLTDHHQYGYISIADDFIIIINFKNRMYYNDDSYRITNNYTAFRVDLNDNESIEVFDCNFRYFCERNFIGKARNV